MKQLFLRNEQRRCRFPTPPLRRNTRVLLDDLLSLSDYNLSILFVSPKRISVLNWNHLSHEGPTDIITFDYSDGGPLYGELVICPWVANNNAHHFRVPLQRELCRYLVHGVLHLLGYDDKKRAARLQMKREEERLLQLLPSDG